MNNCFYSRLIDAIISHTCERGLSMTLKSVPPNSIIRKWLLELKQDKRQEQELASKSLKTEKERGDRVRK